MEVLCILSVVTHLIIRCPCNLSAKLDLRVKVLAVIVLG